MYVWVRAAELLDRSILADHTYTHWKLLLASARHQMTMCGIAEWLVKHTYKQTRIHTHSVVLLFFWLILFTNLTDKWTKQPLTFLRHLHFFTLCRTTMALSKNNAQRGLMAQRIYFPHRTVSCVTQVNLCRAWSQCILRSFSHKSGKEAEKAGEIPSHSTHGYVSSSHIQQSHWKGLTHNVPQFTDSHNDPPARVSRQ